MSKRKVATLANQRLALSTPSEGNSPVAHYVPFGVMPKSPQWLIYANLFATTFFLNGLQQLSQWMHTSHLARPDLVIAVPAWFSNLLVVIGCLWGYSRLSTKRLGDAARFVVTFALTTGFFALDMALFRPRYLGLFPPMLHPHWP